MHTLLLVASLEILQMDSLDDTPSAVPNAEVMWAVSDEKRKQYLEEISGKIVDTFIFFNVVEENKASQDKVFDCTSKILSLGMFYLEFCDSVKEGDGERVLQCWKFLLPIFKRAKRKNYALEAFYLLYQYNYVLPPQQAESFLWSRFVNTHGLQGRNIHCDLSLEHLNHLCKTIVNEKDSNESEMFAFVGKILGLLKPVLDQFDEENSIAAHSGANLPLDYVCLLIKVADNTVHFQSQRICFALIVASFLNGWSTTLKSNIDFI